jgi:hypothetical protein
MNKFFAVLMTLVSIPFLVLGLLFMIASASGANRLLVASALLGIGIVLLVAGLKQLRRLAEISPGALKTSAVELAKRLGGDITAAQLRAEYRIPQDLAVQVLEQLVAEGAAVRENREERVVYVVTGLLPSLAEKVCPYCGTQLPMRTAVRKCPNCGANLEISKT